MKYLPPPWQSSNAPLPREGDIGKVRIPQKIDTTQINMRKPQTAFGFTRKLLNSANRLVLYNRNTAKPHQKLSKTVPPQTLKPPSPGTRDGQMPGELLKFPTDQRTLCRSTSVSMASEQLFLIFKISGPDFFFWTAVQGKNHYANHRYHV